METADFQNKVDKANALQEAVNSAEVKQPEK